MLRICLLTVSVAFLSALAASSSCAQVVAHYTFDEGDGATTLLDSSGNALDGTAANGLVASGGTSNGQIGGAWNFAGGANDSLSDYISLDAHIGSFSGLKQGAISVWYQVPSTIMTNSRMILSAYDSTATNTFSRFMIQNDNNGPDQPIFDAADQGGNPPGEGGLIRGPNTQNSVWHHVVLSVGPSQSAALYVDGELEAVGTEPFWGDMASTLDCLSIGRTARDNIPNGFRFWEGLIDDLVIYDVPIHTTEVRAIHDAGLAGTSLTVSGGITATIDRSTGNLTVTNSDLAREIVGYSFTSDAGALDVSAWDSIEDQNLDPSDTWTALTNTSTPTNEDLSEVQFDSDGLTLGSAGSINFGNVWLKTFDEDVFLDLRLEDSSGNSYTELVAVEFAGGPNSDTFLFGDLDFDGDVDEDDFQNEFRPNFNSDTSTLTGETLQYQAGDLNNDGTVNLTDFHIFNETYVALNPLAAPLTLSVVPEPCSVFLMLSTIVCSGFARRRVS